MWFTSRLKKNLAGAFVLFFVFSNCANGQPLTKEELNKYKDWPRFSTISQFYALSNGAFAWIGNNRVQNQLISLLHQAPSLGLNESDYQASFFKRYNSSDNLATRNDSIEAELHFTDAALHFLSEVKNGNQAPSFRYTGLKYTPGITSVIQNLAAQIASVRLAELAADLQPRSAEYINALSMLNRFLLVAEKNNFSETKIVSTKADSTNKPLLLRLYQFGMLDSVDGQTSKKVLVQKIKTAQQQFDLVADGVLGSATLKAFNTPLAQRIDVLKMLLNTLRWLEQIRQNSPVLILNLPSANFFVYEKGVLQLYSKVVVGKTSTPTPTLTSTITEVVLYPYWMVPHKIATRELLPRIKRNIGYLDNNNYQVLNKQGKVLNPYAISWRALSAGYFPYIIRQSTGCDNALGIVKFNFYNPFTVYLHDTPSKSLFSADRRFFSHGCMRVEKPVELARYVLGFNRIAIDTLTVKGCLYQKEPKAVAVQKQLPVIILYSTAWYNKDGELRFHEDVYNRVEKVSATRTAFLQQPLTRVD